MQFNVNEKVRVKLTPQGRALHAADHALFWAGVSKRPAPEYRPPKEDADGWSEWQLWELMADFGKHLHNGCKVPFETTIEIPNSEVKGGRDER